MPDWSGILRGVVVPETPNVDRRIGAPQLTRPPTPGVVVAFNRDVSQGMVRIADGRVLHFTPGIFYSSVTNPRFPQINEAVQVHFNEHGTVTAVVARPPRLETLVTSSEPGRTWYEFLLEDIDA